MVKATGEGTEPMPTLEAVGTRYREAIVACHQAMSIPQPGRETYREAARLGGRRRK